MNSTFTGKIRRSVLFFAIFAVLTAQGAGCEKEKRGNGEMIHIQGGSFEMGALDRDKNARENEHPRRRVVLKPFYIDRSEVTVREYSEAFEAGAVPEPECPAIDDIDRFLCNWGKKDRLDHPVNGVSWYAASAYCAWRGKRLPTEAEFELVLRNNKNGRIFPWGESRKPPDGFGNYVDEKKTMEFRHWWPIPGYSDDWNGTAPVGSFSPNSFGVYDISGNIWEWCADWFDPRFYGRSPVKNPAGPPEGIHRVMRGGGFHCILDELRCSERHHKPPENASFYTGFRCASDVE